MNDFNLSSNIVNVHKTDNIFEKDFEEMVKKVDVKEFIRLLKKIQIKFNNCEAETIIKEINEIAGEELI